ncbi:MAG: hypothetical protein AAF657_01840 [Acidobacteriota bacterium]
MIPAPRAPETDPHLTFAARLRQLAERPMSPPVVYSAVILSALIFGTFSWLPRPTETPPFPEVGRPWSNDLPRAGDLLDLRTEDLIVTSAKFRTGRNIFAHGDLGRPTADPRGQARRGRQGQPAKEQERRSATPAEPGLDVALLGVFGPTWRRIAVLEHLDGSGISNVLEQDVVQGRYRVQKIDLTSVQLAQTTKPDRPLIRLAVGKEPGSR